VRALVLVTLVALSGCAGSRSLEPDASVMPGADVDVVGRWHDCNVTLTFEADGRGSLVDHRRGCTTTGTWSVEGRVLRGAWGATDCDEPPGESEPTEVFRAPGGLVMVHPETGAVSRYASDETPHGTWILEGADASGAVRTSIARIVGDPSEGFGSGCYWSADEMCGGLFSCSGAITTWRLDEGTLRGAATCGGDCPCSVTIDGMLQEDGAIDGTFRGANCDRTFDGTLTARTEPEPG
jgi:hypothetical protein